MWTDFCSTLRLHRWHSLSSSYYDNDNNCLSSNITLTDTYHFTPSSPTNLTSDDIWGIVLDSVSANSWTFDVDAIYVVNIGLDIEYALDGSWFESRVNDLVAAQTFFLFR